MIAFKEILIVDDDSNDVLLLKLAFAKAGFRFHIAVARDGQEAIDYLEGKPPFNDRELYPRPDLMLLDLRMPRLDGFAVLEWLLGHQEMRPRSVWVFTASAYPEDTRRAYLLGVDNCVFKPQSPGELIQVVRAIGANKAEAVPAL